MRRRAGFTLVELIIVMTAGSTLLMLAIGIVHRSMTIHSSSQVNQRVQRSAIRLSRTLRRDVARAATVVRNGDAWTLAGATVAGSSSTTYAVAGGGVVREQVLADGRLRREEFLFGSDAQIDVTSEPAGGRITLTVAKPRGIGDGPPRIVLHVESTLGRMVWPRKPPALEQADDS